MRYWGKLLGLIIGSFAGIGFWGIVIGVFLGHLYDVQRSKLSYGGRYNRDRQAYFFAATFQVLGHLTKSKGRVTQTDITLASTLMDRMNLHGAARQAAQQAFREGKEVDFPLRATLQRVRQICAGRRDLLQMFLEIQLQAAFADGQLHPNERKMLFIIIDELGFSRTRFEHILAMMQAGQSFHYQQGQNYQPQTQGPTLSDAYKVLGIKEGDDVKTIKRAYRKLMGEHHPDKLVAKGLPPEMMEIAKQKAQAIQVAYDLIKKEKGFR
ncbi:co-chaperone DjlA [Proteus mirabilis]|uniref:co-chaperone DjlA n=1 Tax=Proteus mirabilis TaxID=584 RepID=UPI0021825127|nr:co-chaperone DjlA [Proteus mirabilis]MCT0098077.1 co-chaperone DjlA [Proteus mirabilis]